jgi:hypothetical protein
MRANRTEQDNIRNKDEVELKRLKDGLFLERLQHKNIRVANSKIDWRMTPMKVPISKALTPEE